MAGRVRLDGDVHEMRNEGFAVEVRRNAGFRFLPIGYGG
jgi:hypothetical protein